MQAVLLVVHVIIALALIGMILIQRSDSDGFGLGSGSGSNFMSGRGTANFLTRTTAILATLFIVNSLVLGVMAAHHSKPASIVDVIEEQAKDAPVAAEKKDAPKAMKQDAQKAPEKKKDVKKSEPAVPTE